MIEREHEAFWSGEFGDAYLQRNRVNVGSRVPFWRMIMDQIETPNVALEVGCNAGWNLRAIREINPHTRLLGVDVNENALLEASQEGVNGVFNVPATEVGVIFHKNADIAFTCGVLIHIPPHDLYRVMLSLCDASRRYVLAVEYEDEKEVEVNYRGHSGRLWRRPYGDLYAKMGLKLIDTGPAPEFDDATYWLFEKGDAQ